MSTVAREWIRYGLRVAIVWSNDSVSVGTVVSSTDSSVFVQADGERLRFRKHSLTLFGGTATRIEPLTPALERRAEIRAELRSAARIMRQYAADPRVRHHNDLDEALTALIELRDQITARIAALCELDRP